MLASGSGRDHRWQFMIWPVTPGDGSLCYSVRKGCCADLSLKHKYIHKLTLLLSAKQARNDATSE